MKEGRDKFMGKLLSGICTLWTAVLLLSVASLSGATLDLGLVEAAKSGDGEAVRSLVQGAADVNVPGADGTTALHWAAHWNDFDVAELLIQNGADPSMATDYGVTPLSLACTNGSSRMVRRLLQAGADANAALWTGETVLMTCARTGAAEAVQALLAGGANVNATESRKGQSALMWAAAGGHAEVARALIRNGAEVRGVSKGGFTPLLFAARSGDLNSARQLLEEGADTNESTSQHGNSLVIASAGGHEELAMFLVQQGADPNAADENGITPLHHAARRGLSALNGVRYDEVYRVRPPNMPALAKALLAAGADPNARIRKSHRLGPDGSPFEMVDTTPYLLAAVSADASLMRVLKEGGADPQIRGKGGITALMAAAQAACTGSCAFQGGNDTNQEDLEISFEAVRAAVEMGADVNAVNDEGQTAMHRAAFTGADRVVQYLADHGALVDVKDHYGETPWSMAAGISPVIRYRGLYGTHESTAELLLQLGASQSSREEMDDQAPAPPGQ